MNLAFPEVKLDLSPIRQFLNSDAGQLLIDHRLAQHGSIATISLDGRCGHTADISVYEGFFYTVFEKNERCENCTAENCEIRGTRCHSETIKVNLHALETIVEQISDMLKTQGRLSATCKGSR